MQGASVLAGKARKQVLCRHQKECHLPAEMGCGLLATAVRIHLCRLQQPCLWQSLQQQWELIHKVGPEKEECSRAVFFTLTEPISDCKNQFSRSCRIFLKKWNKKITDCVLHVERKYCFTILMFQIQTEVRTRSRYISLWSWAQSVKTTEGDSQSPAGVHEEGCFSHALMHHCKNN